MTTTGTVTAIQVVQDGSTDFAKITLVESSSGQSEQFVLWGAPVGTPTPFSVWIARSHAVSLVRDALVNKLAVTVLHDDTSALIKRVTLQSA
jgi:hypothetical protein